MMCLSIESCLESINYAIDFISNYDYKDYNRKGAIYLISFAYTIMM